MAEVEVEVEVEVVEEEGDNNDKWNIGEWHGWSQAGSTDHFQFYTTRRLTLSSRECHEWNMKTIILLGMKKRKRKRKRILLFR